VIVLLDDVGFGAAGTFGRPIPTPTLDALAAEGLRYNTFRTTALCSPTPAALLTGRNHHVGNTGNITEYATGYDSYNCIISKTTATVAQVLVEAARNQVLPLDHRGPKCVVGARPPDHRR
jgi:arylsulfatase A-like enzyme